jgi:hypothetical protein
MRGYKSYGRDQINIENSGDISIGLQAGSAVARKRYIIGLDLGDGESCLSYVAADVSLTADRSIFFLNKRSTIPTAIAESHDGAILIGEEAIGRSDAIELEVNFKLDPKKSKRD